MLLQAANSLQDGFYFREPVAGRPKLEPLVKAETTLTSKEEGAVNQFFTKHFPKYGYLVSSMMHAITGLNCLKNFLPKSLTDFLNTNTARVSKAVTSIRYAHLAIEALRNNKIFDFIARVLDPLFVPWMKLEDIHLARGMSAGMTLLDFTQNRLVGNAIMSKTDNFFKNIKAGTKILEEIVQGGLGKDRKIFVGTEKDQGHTMALFGHMIFVGSLLGVMFGANKRNVMNKIGGLIRNIGGFAGDMTMVQHKDPDMKRSGIFYAINAVIDALQRFLPKEIIDPINHFNMILNNIGTYFYGKISQNRNENTLVDFA